MEQQSRRATDGLDLTPQQRAFLDQVCSKVVASVSEAVKEHEESTSHLCGEEIEEVVQVTLAAGNFLLPNGQRPKELLAHHDDLKIGQAALERRHDSLDRSMGRVLDVVVGPVETDFLGDPDPDGRRDESKGLMAKTEIAVSAAQKLDTHLSNGGVPVKLPTSIKAAIWGAAATVSASVITAAGFIVSAAIT